MVKRCPDGASEASGVRSYCLFTIYLLLTLLAGYLRVFLLHAWYSHGMRWVFLPTCAHIHTDASKLLKRCPYGASEASGVRSYYSLIIYLVFAYYLLSTYLLLITYLLLAYYLLIT